MTYEAKKSKIIVVLGPTSSGKSALAVEIAKKFDGEIVSADSRQVYKGLDLGTGKVTKKEMVGIPHHLLSIASPRRDFSAGRYKKLSDRAIKDILKRKKVPIVCGGTAFYIRQIIDNVSLPAVPRNSALRKELEEKTASELFKELLNLDPERAEIIDPHNKVRLVRAIEIARAIGAVPRQITKEQFYKFLIIGLSLPEEKLKQNIRKRLKIRMKQGMLKEVQQLHDEKKISWKRLGLLGIEYHYLALHLQKKLALDEALNLIGLKSLQYAKNQMKWWKKEKDIHWINPLKTDAAVDLVKNFLER